MATNPRDVEALERAAAQERQQVSRRVAEIRQQMDEQLDVKRLAAERIHARPGAFYGAAAGVAGLVGYLFGRLLKI